MDELIKQIASLQAELTELKLKSSLRERETQERIELIEESIDRVYYLKGRSLAGTVDVHIAHVEKMICEEYEIRPYAFHKDNKKASELDTDTCVLARWVLYVLLNKHLGMTHATIQKRYGFFPNVAKAQLEALFKSKPKEKETFDKIDIAVFNYVKEIRP